MTLLNVSRMLLKSRANGPGLRSVIWVQGCSIRCPGCINKDFQDPHIEYLVDPLQLLKSILEHAPEIEGISISGGEPFEQPEGCAELLSAAKQMNLSTLVFTGHCLESLVKKKQMVFNDMLASIDILIDGPYVAAKKGRFLLRGSLNQRIIFLSDRYCQKDLEGDLPDEEIIFDPQAGILSFTG